MTGGIVILEGADGVGKTTLARKIVGMTNGYYIHNGLWKPGILVRHLAAARLAARKAVAGRIAVIDRLYLSEVIYGTVFRSGPAYDPALLDRALTSLGAVTVLCVRRDVERHMADFEILKASRPEKFERMEKVAEAFLALAEAPPPSATLYDMDEDDLDAAAFGVLDKLRERRPKW